VLVQRHAVLGGLGVLAVALLAMPAPATATGAAPRDTVGGSDLAAPGVVMHPRAGATALPKIDADTWLVADLTTGEVLAAKGAHTKVLPASTLKTLTALTLMPVLDKTQVVTASEKATHADGSHVGLVSGGTYTVWDLWHALLLPSANDAAFALAEANGGMVATVRAMQARAVDLGALDTVVKSDSGLDHPGQVTSAYDMALFARAAMANPDFATVTRTVSYSFPGRMPAAGSKRTSYKIYSQNRLLLHRFSGIVGGKTGFTTLAHRTFWAAATRGGHTLVVTLFQIHEPTETAAKALLTWGFANRDRVTPVGTLVEPASASGAAPSPSSDGGSTLSASAAHGTTSVSFAALPKRGLLAGAALIALVVGGVWWWRRSSAAPTPPLVPTPSAPTRSAFEPRGHVTTSHRTGTPPSTPPGPVAAAPVDGPAEAVEADPAVDPLAPVPTTTSIDVSGAPGIDDTSPIPVVVAPERPAPVGNVRVVRPGRPPAS
jgi:D-alanyl-D-alanine carboxypeptidase (penicillin-binding protein 5/6)